MKLRHVELSWNNNSPVECPAEFHRGFSSASFLQYLVTPGYCNSSWGGSHLHIQDFIKGHVHISCRCTSTQRWGNLSMALTLALDRNSWCIWTELSRGRTASSSKTRPALIPDESPSQVSAPVIWLNKTFPFSCCLLLLPPWKLCDGCCLSGVQKNNPKLQKDCS